MDRHRNGGVNLFDGQQIHLKVHNRKQRITNNNVFDITETGSGTLVASPGGSADLIKMIDPFKNYNILNSKLIDNFWRSYSFPKMAPASRHNQGFVYLILYRGI
jgi:hypothetical protein